MTRGIKKLNCWKRDYLFLGVLAVIIIVFSLGILKPKTQKVSGSVVINTSCVVQDLRKNQRDIRFKCNGREVIYENPLKPINLSVGDYVKLRYNYIYTDLNVSKNSTELQVDTLNNNPIVENGNSSDSEIRTNIQILKEQ